MTEYTPSDEVVRTEYMIAVHLSNGTPISGAYRGLETERGTEFDRWLQSVKADAWGEGYGLGVEVGHRGDDYWETNPYRKAGKHE